MPVLSVDLGDRSYEIIIEPELLQDARQYLEPLIKKRRVAVVSDAVVQKNYQSLLAPVLDKITPRWDVYLIQDGERAKSFNGIETLLKKMLADGIDRSCVLLAFGGGVVGDVGGFAASLLMRGIDLIQIPTTLLSQVDSSVGGKNGINTEQGKNLVGSFLQPQIVLNDVSLLDTLPVSEMRSGYGEILKCALLRGEQQLSWLEQNAGKVLTQDKTAQVEAVHMSCETKAKIVSEDEFDKGKRALVNLGHTFAHAFETQAGFGVIPHGCAVTVGLIAACELSHRAGFTTGKLAERVRNHVKNNNMATDLPSLSANTDWAATALHQHMFHDKKTVGGKLNFVLLRNPGEPFVTSEVSAQDILDTLTAVGAS